MGDPIDWADAFENGAYVPGAGELPEVWAARAEAFRAALGPRAELDMAYGSGPRHRFDLFRPEGTARGLLTFIHGGYWRAFDKSLWSHFAAGSLAHGWAVAMPSYTLAPEARIARIGGEVARAITHAAALVPGPLRLTGHSAGGHLAARMICENSPLPGNVRKRVERAVPISGVYDLAPLMGSPLNDMLNIDTAEATAESPLRFGPPFDLPVTLWVGAAERPEFLRQTRALGERWGGKGARVDEVYEPGQNHFTVIDALTEPDSPLTKAIAT